MDSTYQPRWPAVLAAAAPFGLLCGALAVGLAALMDLLADWSEPLRDMPVMGPFLAVFGTIMSVAGLRSRRLTVRDDSLLVERDGLRIALSWRDFAEVRERRLGPVRVDELVFHASDVQPPLTMDITGWRAARLRRVRPSLYMADWRGSPIGAGCPAC